MNGISPDLFLMASTRGAGFGAAAPGASATSAEQRALDARKLQADRQAPWAERNALTPSRENARLREIMNAASLLSPTLARSRASTDEQQMFRVWQALEGLRLIAERAQTDRVPEGEMAALQRRFERGMKETQSLIGALDTERVAIAAGTLPSSVTASAGVARRTPGEYVSLRAAHTGASTAPVAALEGDVRFDVAITRQTAGGPQAVRASIDLADLGAQPRTLDNFINHVNARIRDAGGATRLERYELPPAPGAREGAPQRWGFKLVAGAGESVRLEPAPGAVERSVTIVSSVGGPLEASGEISEIRDGGAIAVHESAIETGKAGSDAPTTGLIVRAAARGPDGSSYVVGETPRAMAGAGGLRGASDLVLIKYDSAGQQTWTRTLGAAEGGGGYDVAVGADGTVAVAGVLTGAGARGVNVRGGAEAVVATFGADGAERWVRTIGAGAADEARSVAIGPNGDVWVGGRTRSWLGGSGPALGWDGFVQRFSATGTAQGMPVQFSGALDGGVDALAVTADGVFAAGAEGARGVVRKLDQTGALQWSLDAGALGADGAIRSIAVDGTTIALGGVSEFQTLGVGPAPVTAGSAGDNGFVMRLTDQGASASVDWSTFVSGAGDDRINDVQIADGQIYVAGALEAPKQDPRPFVGRLDAATGQETWRQLRTGPAERGEAVAVMVDPQGLSALDRLGLPMGDVPLADSTKLIERTALRPGDHFFLQIGERPPRRITIEAGDTMQTLASRLRTALRGAGDALSRTSTGEERLQIRATNGQTVTLLRGGNGQDALGALGLPPGKLIHRENQTGPQARRADRQPPVATLRFDANLSFTDRDGAKSAMEAIERVQRAVRSAYAQSFTARQSPGAQPVAPRFDPAEQARLQNYQSALRRLGGGT